MRRTIVGSAKRLGIALTIMAVVVAPAPAADAAARDAGSRAAPTVSSPAADGLSAAGLKASSKARFPIMAELRNWNTNQTKCMGVEGGYPMDGSRVVLWPCGELDHVWYVDFSSGYHEIRNYRDRDKCLGVLGGSHRPGAPLVTWTCDNTPNQLWRTEDSSVCQGVILVNAATGPEQQLASVEGRSTENNASIIQWPHASSPDQTWCPWT
jgi:hypothetical protein